MLEKDTNNKGANIKINLLITVFDLHFGGISNLILQTTPALMREMNVCVVYFGPKEEMLPRFKNSGIRIERLPYNGSRDLLKTGKKLASLIDKKQINVVSTHLFVDKAITSIARQYVKFKHVSTLHSVQNPYSKGIFSLAFKNRLEDLYHNHIVDKNIAVSKASLDSWKRFRGLKHKNSTVLYSGIENLSCIKENKQHLKDNTKIFVTACRFTKEKGLERLIKLFFVLNEFSKNWQFWIIGDGLLRTELKKLVEKLRLEDQVIFKGFQTDLCKFYKEADFYINSSFHEALPVSIIEAMSVGMPVIGSNVGGIPEVIDHGVNGYLVDFQNTNERLDILKNCLGMSKKKYEQLSQNSIETFKTRFSIENYTANFNNEMRQLLEPTA